MIRDACNKILEKTNIVKKIDVELWKFAEIFPLAIDINDIKIKDTLSTFDIILKNSSLCVFGGDSSKHIPSIKPDIALANDELIVIYDDIVQARKAITNRVFQSEVLYWCRRVMKNIICAGFCLCVPIVQVQTREIKLCAKVFSRYYCDMTKFIHKALDLSEQPSELAEEVLE